MPNSPSECCLVARSLVSQTRSFPKTIGRAAYARHNTPLCVVVHASNANSAMVHALAGPRLAGRSRRSGWLLDRNQWNLKFKLSAISVTEGSEQTLDLCIASLRNA